ncbi:MAG: hypothetical protein V7K32_25605 [Nostoc sp.]|uniref:hypothetical protein n=1 Tax=Nostoc sp. TaxID=1180 RepID=UPI002FFBB555
MTEYSRLKTSRSAAIKASLDYPIIDTDVHNIIRELILLDSTTYFPLTEQY